MYKYIQCSSTVLTYVQCKGKQWLPTVQLITVYSTVQ